MTSKIDKRVARHNEHGWVIQEGGEKVHRAKANGFALCGADLRAGHWLQLRGRTVAGHEDMLCNQCESIFDEEK